MSCHKWEINEDPTNLYHENWIQFYGIGDYHKLCISWKITENFSINFPQKSQIANTPKFPNNPNTKSLILITL
jgi:hypothetical protein